MDKDQLKKLMAKFPCKQLETGNIRTCPARLSYPNIWEKSRGEDGFKASYGATLLFPKGADLSIIREAVKHVAIEKFGSKAGSMSLKLPFRDQGEKEGKAGYEKGAVFFRASSDMQPGVLGPDGRPLNDQKKLYAGAWVLATVRPFAFDKMQKGVSLGLQNLALIADDEAFGGVPANAADEFADVLEGAAEAKGIFDEAESVHDFG
jgi:hypothetical protein